MHLKNCIVIIVIKIIFFIKNLRYQNCVLLECQQKKPYILFCLLQSICFCQNVSKNKHVSVFVCFKLLCFVGISAKTNILFLCVSKCYVLSEYQQKQTYICCCVRFPKCCVLLECQQKIHKKLCSLQHHLTKL